MLWSRRTKRFFYGILIALLLFTTAFLAVRNRSFTDNLLSNERSPADPKSCLTTNGSDARLVIVLSLKTDNFDNRRVVRQKWSPIERKCLYKIIISTRVSSAPASGSEEDVLFVSEDADYKKFVTSWVRTRCLAAEAVILGEKITKKSAIVQLEGLSGMMLGKIPAEADVFLACSGEALLSERRNRLYVLDRNHGETSLSQILANIDSENTRQVRYLLMDKQDEVVNPDTFNFESVDPAICRTDHSDVGHVDPSPTEPFMLVFTHSDAKHFRLRQKIRETWGSPSILRRNRAVNMFVLGLPPETALQEKIEQEQRVYKDIVQGNFPESYRHLSFKHRTALKFVLEHCDKLAYKYVLKTDDDIVLDVDGFVHYLQELDKTTTQLFSHTFFCAHLIEDDRVPRNKSFKWYISPEEYPGYTYPSYCYGNAYVMTRDLIQPLYDMSLYTRHFWVDDVYFSGFLARNLPNVTHAELPYQHPIYSKIVPPEVVLEKKKWLVHTWQDEEAFDAYWFGFQSRYDLAVRKVFSEGVQHRTGVHVSDSVFDRVTFPQTLN